MISLHAVLTSYRKERTSVFIEDLALVLDVGEEVGVFQCLGFDEVDGAVEEVVECFPEFPIGSAVLKGWQGLEFDEEVDVAGVGVEGLVVACGADEFEAFDAELAAQLLKLGQMCLYESVHG